MTVAFRNRSAGVVVLGIMGAAAWFQPWAAAQQADQATRPAGAISTQPAARIMVATVDAQAVLQAYERTDTLQNELREVQQEAMAAQQAQDQQKLMQLSQRFQKLREDGLTSLLEDVNSAVRKIAEREHYDLVAGSVMYKGERLNVPDITQEVIKNLNDAYEPPATQPSGVGSLNGARSGGAGSGSTGTAGGSR